MTRWSSMLLAVVVLALMGLARLPVPCLGDGHGHPCAIEACACTEACSCKLSCEAMATDPHYKCHMGGQAGAEPPAHFSLPDQPPAALAIRPLWAHEGAIALDRPASAPALEAPLLPLPEPPPRSLC